MPMMKRNVVLSIAAAVFLVAAVALNWWFGIKDSEPAAEAPKARIEVSSPGYFSIEELSDASDAIVVGVFGDVISREVDYGIEGDDSFEDDWGIPMVFHRVEVKERLKGEPGSEIIVALFDVPQAATNEIKPIEEGKRYVLFLSDITEDAHRFEKYADADKDIYITLSDDIGIFELSEDDIATPRESVISRRTPDGDVVSSFSLQEIQKERFEEQEDVGVRNYAHIFADKPGDDNIVAIVGQNGEYAITRGDLRVMAEANALHQPGVSTDEILDEVIVPRLGTTILYAEAIRLGHEPTQEEVQEYIQPFKEVCDGPQGGDCRELIKAQGYTAEEEYWKDAIQGYTQELAIMNLRRAYPETMSSDSTEAYELSLHDSAEIDWKDDKLKARYELALRKAKSGNVEDE